MSDFKIVKLLNPISINVPLNPRGVYNPASTYAVADLVSVNGVGYICIAPTTGNAPPNTAYWQLFSQTGSRIYSAAGVPSSTLGIDNDFYINSANGDYYLKVSGSWVLQGNLTGPTGPAGPAGVGVPTGGTIGQILAKQSSANYDTAWINLTAGTVTSVSVASANGFAGTVTNPTTTPSITLSTSVTGLLKGNGTAISAAIAGTDYQAPITLTTTGNGASTLVGSTLNIPNMLYEVTVDSYIGTLLNPSNAALNGFGVSKSINGAVGFRAQNTDDTSNAAVATIGVKGSGSTYVNGLSMNYFNHSYFVSYLQDSGALYTDKNLFYISLGYHDFRTGTSVAGATSKLKIDNDGTVTAPAFTNAMITAAGNQSLITLGYLNAVLPAPLTASAPLNIAFSNISITQANTSTDGYLSSTDWNTFNNKVDFVTSIVHAIVFG